MCQLQDPNEFLDAVWNDPNIHILEQQYNLHNKMMIKLINISLYIQKSKYQNKQQKIQLHLDSSFYRTNIRQGMIIIQNKNWIQWGCKGPKKSISLKLQYIAEQSRKQKNQKIPTIIFQKVNQALKKNKRVELIKKQKINGQLFLVSFCKRIDHWIISVGNQSLIIYQKSELNRKYKDKKCQQLKFMTKEWLALINTISSDQKYKLKKLLTGNTLYGHCCDGGLIWSGMTRNCSSSDQMDSFEVKKQLQELGLQFVKVRSLGIFKQETAFYDSLTKMYKEVVESSIENTQFIYEGSEVQFILQEMAKTMHISKHNIGTVSIKNLQHSFYQLMHQKWIQYVELNKNLNETKIIQQYTIKCKQLQKQSGGLSAYPFHYYQYILSLGFQLLKQTFLSSQFVRKNFSKILKLVMYCSTKAISINKFGTSLIQNNNFMQQVENIDIHHYGAIGCNVKIIYIMFALPPRLGCKTIGHQIKSHLKLLSLDNQIISDKAEGNRQQFTNQSQFIQYAIQCINKPNQQHTLQYYYIDSKYNLQCTKILIPMLRQKQNPNTYCKLIVIQQCENLFVESYNEYPYSLQTIIEAYLSIYRPIKHLSTINEKIVYLNKVTQNLRNSVNINDDIKYSYNVMKYGLNRIQPEQQQQLSKKQALNEEDNNIPQKIMHELTIIILKLLQNQKQYENYCRLIIKLQYLELYHIKWEFQNHQIKKLISKTFKIIDTFNFESIS